MTYPETEWVRVSPSSPCPVCGKPDYCGVSEDGTAAVCMRTESDRGTKNGGWLHRLADVPTERRVAVRLPDRKPAKPAIDWKASAAGFAKNLDAARRGELAAKLGLPADVLDALPLVGWNPMEGCWTFPEVDGDGKAVGLNRRFRDGTKKVAAGGSRGLYVPAGWRDRPGPVFLVEGASDVLALTACGLSAVGRPSNCLGADQLAVLLRDLPAGRVVLIVAENDQKPDGSWPGRAGAKRTAADLSAKLRRDVPFVLPPPAFKDMREWVRDLVDGSGESIDWTAIGSEIVTTLAPDIDVQVVAADPESAVAVYAPPASGEAWNDPHRLARLYADSSRTAAGERTVVQWRGEYHRWTGDAWKAWPESDLNADLSRHCRAVFTADYPARLALERDARRRPTVYPVTTQLAANVRLNLSGIVNRRDDGGDSPFWLDPAPSRPAARDVIAAQNGLYTVADLIARRPAFSPPTPAFFSPVALPFDVNPRAAKPREWLRCLDQWFNADAASIAGAQEWAGYLLTPDTSAQKILMLIGQPRSGKGTILSVLTALVGAKNVGSTSFADLTGPFGLQALVGKTLVTLGDARLSGRTDASAAVERLLSISGGDQQPVNRKNREAVSARLPVRFVIATNELPRLPDASGAVASRFHVLHTPNTWLNREDTGLLDRLLAELPGILLWAVDGLARLRSRGMQFTPNDAAGEFRRELEDLSSPIRAFVRECCRVGPDQETEIPEVYAAWRLWNEERHREVSSENIFGRDLRAVLPHIKSTQRRRDTGRIRMYSGVGLKARIEWGE